MTPHEANLRRTKGRNQLDALRRSIAASQQHPFGCDCKACTDRRAADAAQALHDRKDRNNAQEAKR